MVLVCCAGLKCQNSHNCFSIQSFNHFSLHVRKRSILRMVQQQSHKDNSSTKLKFKVFYETRKAVELHVKIESNHTVGKSKQCHRHPDDLCSHPVFSEIKLYVLCVVAGRCAPPLQHGDWSEISQPSALYGVYNLLSKQCHHAPISQSIIYFRERGMKGAATCSRALCCPLIEHLHLQFTHEEVVMLLLRWRRQWMNADCCNNTCSTHPQKLVRQPFLSPPFFERMNRQK